MARHPHTPPSRAPLFFTFVTFPEDDLLGELLGWISLVPLAFFVIEAAFVLVDAQSWKQRKAAFWILAGQTLNEFISYRLKACFEEARPTGTALARLRAHAV